MLPTALLRGLPRFIPERLLNRPAIQVLRAKFAVAARRNQTTIAPGIPIVGQISPTRRDWRRDVSLLLWTLAREALSANDRFAWLICAGFPSEEAIDDLYALAVQAEPVVQLHILQEQAEVDEFNRRFVPSASLEEADQRRTPEVHEALAQIAIHPGVFTRVTSSLSLTHTLVKQFSSGQLAVAADITQLRVARETLRQAKLANLHIRVFLMGDPLQAPEELADTGDIVVVRRLGLSFLEELALIKLCDAYIGACDHGAIFAADAGIPCLLESDVEATYGHRIRCVSDPAAAAAFWLQSIALPAKL